MTTSSFPLPSLAGYGINEILYDGEKSMVYRGVRQSDNLPVVIKLLKRALPTYNELLEFRHQYNLLSDIHIEGIVAPLALESWQEKLALIMPDNGSIDLQLFIKQKEDAGQETTINDFLDIAIQLANILDQLHQQGITHKDIKPANIIIQPEISLADEFLPTDSLLSDDSTPAEDSTHPSRKVALIDFSIATQLSVENLNLQNPDTLSGTLSYISPEQTGRMNRGVDYRTDFYSLGVTFYEFLSGHLPFNSTDALELVHSHLAREASPLQQLRPDIPAVINDIIQKLMAKNAEDRYQSGAGLMLDLQRCKQQLHTKQPINDIQSFTLGQGDAAQHFCLSEKLYGRFNEVKKLLNSFERVCDGNMEAVMVSGLSGIGKTALINEVHKPMTRSHGYFIKGKFEPLKRDTPFSGLSQALRMLVKQLLGESNEQRQRWREKILNAVGHQGQLLIDLIPELSQLLGEQPVVEDQQGAEAAHRFQHLMQQFFQVFTHKSHPLVLFLDDLQWIDTATLQLLPILFHPSDVKNNTLSDETNCAVLFIGAYRDNETLPGHPLLQTLDSLKKQGLPLIPIALAPLSESDLNHLVADACQCRNEQAAPLSQIVFDKTEGNPFFTHQFIQQAADENLLHYNFEKEYWDYDLDQIRQLAASADVIEFMAEKIRKLDLSVQKVLQLAACIGNRFKLSTLMLVGEMTVTECAASCWHAIQSNLLVPIGENYKLLQNNMEEEIEGLNIDYCFAHDRIQQAAYSLIPEEQKAKLHLNIGRLLKQQSSENESAEKEVSSDPVQDELFEIVNQLNAGRTLISEVDERIELARLNQLAGYAAKRATAYDAAQLFFRSGLELLNLSDNETSWQTDYSLTLALTEGAAEVAFLLGDYIQQQQYADIILRQSQTLVDEIKTHQLHCLSLIASNDPLSAIQYALPILKQCGIEFPESPGSDDFQRELTKTQALIGDRKVDSLIDLPMMSDPIIIAGVRLLEMLSSALYIAIPALYPLAVFKKVQLAIKYGNAPEIVPFYGAYGFLLSAVVNDIDTGYEFGLLAMALLDKLQARAQRVKTYVVVFGNRFHKKPIRDSISSLRKGSQFGMESGDLHYSAVSLLWANVYSFFSGLELQGLEKVIERDQYLMSDIHQDVCLNYNKMLQQVILNLSGASNAPERLQGNAYQIDISLPLHEQANDRFAICMAHNYQAILAYLFYDDQNALNASDSVEEYLDAIIGSLFSPEYSFYNALILLACYREESIENQAVFLSKINFHQEILANLSRHAPMNFQHKWALVEAERCRIQDEPLMAMEYYHEAIALAYENKFIQEEALACELAGRFYLSRNQVLFAQPLMTRAYYAWARWGAKAKTEQLEMLYPELLDLLTREESDAIKQTHTTSTKTTTTIAMDFTSVMKSAQMLSSELNLSGLLNKLLNLVMENAGAQRTVLLLRDSSDDESDVHNSWHIAAECRMDDQTRQILHNDPLDDYHDIPKTMLMKVIEKSLPVVLDDAQESYQPFFYDPYFIQNRNEANTTKKTQKSVLCQPVLSQGRLVGVLYLENKLTTHVFHQSRLQMMQMMAAQAAISIENAQLYEHLEEKVRERTAALKQAQAQLLKHARESGMAEIAIEVMHNIGNALTPLKTKTEQTYSAMHNSDLVKNTPHLMKRLADALQTHNDLDSIEREKLTQITTVLPEVIANDYQTHADNLEKACDTIRRIEEFIHLQSKYTTVKPMKENLDVNELLNDALKMLDNLMRSEHIELILKQENLPKLFAEEYQLLQIILSVIKNACESMTSIAIEHRRLMINTLLEKNVENNLDEVDFIILQIQDNGTGFAPEMKERIFAADYTSPKKHQHHSVVSSSSGFKLHACANYLIANGGSINAYSEGEGKGAIFTMKLPLKNDQLKVSP
ncbi:MAG: trifunctional serine/threonine-protein kinase/ATP-binding protein/sensor histidine kinase [Gammaproteobacteria bacterium]|nr:trifunctional serine/threonine-protein kinase/ATP-binding protein/sensor histidine kinase [Gammaproteobacteria bacterium]